MASTWTIRVVFNVSGTSFSLEGIIVVPLEVPLEIIPCSEEFDRFMAEKVPELALSLENKVAGLHVSYKECL